MASLLVNQGDLSGQTIPLDRDSVIFGRKHEPLECDVIISKAKAVSAVAMPSRIFQQELRPTTSGKTSAATTTPT